MPIMISLCCYTKSSNELPPLSHRWYINTILFGYWKDGCLSVAYIHHQCRCLPDGEGAQQMSRNKCYIRNLQYRVKEGGNK